MSKTIMSLRTSTKGKNYSSEFVMLLRYLNISLNF